LERAWNEGYREPQAACALGMALGELYRGALSELDRISDPDLRQARRDEIDRELRQPALDALRRGSAGDAVEGALITGLIAYYEGDLERALARAREAFAGAPGVYEAKLLEGRVLVARAAELREAEAWDSVPAVLDAARDCFAEASATARSSAPICIAEAERSIEAMIAAGRVGSPMAPVFEDGLAACGRAEAIHPGSLDALLVEAELHRTWAQLHLPKSPRVSFVEIDEAVRLAEAAVDSFPESARARRALGSILTVAATYEYRAGRDPRGTIDRGAACYQWLVEGRGAPWQSLINLAVLYSTRAQYEARLDLDASRSFELAAECCERAAERSRDRRVQYSALHNLGGVLEARATFERYWERDSGPWVDGAVDAFSRALHLAPGRYETLNGLGNAYLARARQERGRGEDPRESLDEAVEVYGRAIESFPRTAFARKNLADALIERGQYESLVGIDPRPTWERAREALGAALDHDSTYLKARISLGRLAILMARDDLRRGRDPSAAISAARSALGRALEQSPNHVLGRHYMAQIEVVAARAAMVAGATPEESLRRAEAIYRRLSEERPGDADARLGLADVGRFRAVRAVETGADPAAFLEAATSRVEEALQLWPGWDDAELVKAHLLLLESHSSSSARDPTDLAGEALELLTPLAPHEAGPEDDRLRLIAEAEALLVGGDVP
jgi:serine/threonine-protein kinase